MGQIAMSVFPPEYWEDFEQLTWDICKIIWEDDFVQRHGRVGQNQSGVDVYGRGYGLSQKWVGIQCKKRSQIDSAGHILAGGLLTKDEIQEEIKRAESFQPSLSQFIFATTALRDVKTQEIIRKVDDNQRAKGSFGISIWFWEDYQQQLNQHPQLMYRYYDQVLRSRGAYDPDKHILYFLHTAFSRPAFDTPFNIENSGHDFLRAIKSTQEAIRTGRLKDNDGNIIETAQRANKLSNPKWRDTIAQMTNLLQLIRNSYTTALQQGSIEERDNFLVIHDRQTADKLNQWRADAVRLLNEILAEAQLDSVRSSLLRGHHPSSSSLLAKVKVIRIPRRRKIKPGRG